jgi:hypothetical protein
MAGQEKAMRRVPMSNELCGVCEQPRNNPDEARHPACERAIEGAYQEGYNAGLDDAPLLAERWALN